LVRLKGLKSKAGLSVITKDTATLADLATAALRDKILDLSLEPGEHLEEKKLLEKFPFGRTPIREALNRLMSERLIEARNGRGAYVANMSVSHTMQLLEAYVISERVISSLLKFEDPNIISDLEKIQFKYEEMANSKNILGITEWNRKFHNRLAQATGNHFLIGQAAELHNLARRLSYFVYRSEQESPTEYNSQLLRIARQHHEIIKFIKEKNRSELVALICGHAELFRQRLGAVIGGGHDSQINFSMIRSQK